MISALFGGILIGLAASLLWFANHKIAGVSGLMTEALLTNRRLSSVPWLFLGGLFAAGAVFGRTTNALSPSITPLGGTVLAGLLVGFGARLSNGCTSGHGVCGLSRFSTRSLVATLTFIGTGALTVLLVSHVLPSLGVSP